LVILYILSFSADLESVYNFAIILCY